MIVQTGPAVATPPVLVIEPTPLQQAPPLLAPVIEPVPLLQLAPPKAAAVPLAAFASPPAVTHTSLPRQPSASPVTPADSTDVKRQPAVSPAGLPRSVPPQEGSSQASVGIAPPPSQGAAPKAEPEPPSQGAAPKAEPEPPSHGAAPKAGPEPPSPSLIQNPSQNGSPSSKPAPQPAAVEPNNSALTSHQSPGEGPSPVAAPAEAPPAVRERQTSVPTIAAAEQPVTSPSPAAITTPISTAALRQQAPMPSQSSEGPSVRVPPPLAAQLDQNGSGSVPGQQPPASQPNAADKAAPLGGLAPIGSSSGSVPGAPALQTPALAPSLAAGQLHQPHVPQPSLEQVPAHNDNTSNYNNNNSPSVPAEDGAVPQLSPEGAALESSHAPADASSPVETVAEVPVEAGVAVAPASSQVREIARLSPSFKAVVFNVSQALGLLHHAGSLSPFY